jgi:hypothetical protein
MSLETTAFERELCGRLDRLERQVRWWRRGALAVGGLAALAVAGAMAEPPLKELDVRTLRVVDADGHDRIVLTSDPQEPDITLFDPSGKSRLTIDIAKDQRPVLQFAEREGKTSSRLVLGFEEEGLPALMFYDSKGRKRVALGVPKEGGAVIRVLDENERLRTRFP